MEHSELTDVNSCIDQYLNHLNLNDLLSKSGIKNVNKTLVCYVIHALPEMMSLLNFIETHGLFIKQNLLLILKSSSFDSVIKQKLIDDNYQVSQLHKDDFIHNPSLVHNELSSYCQKHGLDKIIILDHGGYFAYNLKEYRSLPIIGIVEYALNGKKRYYNVNQELSNIPIYMIGESKLKEFSDYSCGIAIGKYILSDVLHYEQEIVSEWYSYAESTPELTVKLKANFEEKMVIGVIGHGRVSCGITDTLFGHVEKILVYDTDPYSLIKAQHNHLDISCTSIETLIQQVNLIVIGTDTAPLMPEHYSLMQHNTGIVTVTSSDDSLGLKKLVSDGYLKKIQQNKYFSSYVNLKGDVIHLACDGEAPNLALHVSPRDVRIAMPYILQLLIGYGILHDQQGLDPYLIETFLMQAYLSLFRELKLGNINTPKAA